MTAPMVVAATYSTPSRQVWAGTGYCWDAHLLWFPVSSGLTTRLDDIVSCDVTPAACQLRVLQSPGSSAQGDSDEEPLLLTATGVTPIQLTSTCYSNHRDLDRRSLTPVHLRTLSVRDDRELEPKRFAVGLMWSFHLTSLNPASQVPDVFASKCRGAEFTAYELARPEQQTKQSQQDDCNSHPGDGKP